MSIRWSAPTAVDPSLSSASVSCPSAGFCVAVGQNADLSAAPERNTMATGNAAVLHGGSWTEPTTIDATTVMVSVSCASTSFCVAVGGADAVVFDGSTWGPPVSIDPQGVVDGAGLGSVSCPSSSFCVAVDAAGNAVTFDGSSWSTPVGIDDASDARLEVSCTSSSFCAAVDGEGDALTFDGGSWTAPASVGVAQLNSVSCSSSSDCVAVGFAACVTSKYSGPCVGSESVTFTGGSWDPPMEIAGDPGVSLVSCPSTSFCMANGDYGAVVLDGAAWSGPLPADGGASGLSCSSASSCVEMDPSGVAESFDGVSFDSFVAVGGGGDVVSCGSPSFCVAVDGNGRALRFNGVSWSSPEKIDGLRALTSVSCRPTGFCMAADYSGHVLTLSRGAWSRPKTLGRMDSPMSVSCPSSRFCIANGVVGRTARTWMFRDGSWTHSIRLPINGALTCATETFCVDVGGTEATGFNGMRWSRPRNIVPYGADLWSASCAVRTFCVAMDRNLGGATTFDGTRWGTLTRVEDRDDMSSVSCPRPGFCVSVTNDQAVTLSGAAWSRPSTIDTPNELASVSCPSTTRCVAVDIDGRALTAEISGVPKFVPHAGQQRQATENDVAAAGSDHRNDTSS